MLASAIPVKYTLVWAQNAGGSFIRVVPNASQIGIQGGAASFNDGWVPLNMTLPAAGGIPPFGQDFNGIFKVVTQWEQWYQAGGPIAYDATFQTAITGYPLGAKVGSASVVGRYWTSTTDGNTTNPDASGAGWLGSQDLVVPATGAQLQFTSATVLTLAPKNGGLLWVNGFNYVVPASLTVTNGGLGANTPYYVYAAISGGVMVLDAPSTTGYALAANGMPQKSGDPTRTLVGMVQTNGSSQFVQQDGSWQVISYFQRALQRSRTQFSTDRTTNSGTFVEINTEIRNSFLVWAGENVEFHTDGSFSCAANQTAATQISFDGGATEQESVAVANNSGTNRGACAINGVKKGLAEGLHYATLFGATGAGTGTWSGSNTASTAQVSLIISLQA